MNPSQKFLVCLYSEPNFLAVNVLENLLANNCFINIITDDTRGWIEKTSKIVARNKFSIVHRDEFQKGINYSYIIFCSGFLSKDKTGTDIEKFLKTVEFQNKKTFFILPKEIYGTLKTNSFGIPDNAGIIYLGDLLGPRIDLESDLKLPVYLSEIIRSRSLSVPVGEILYPIFVSDAAKQIVKWLFAFGPFGKETFLLGPDTSSSIFWQANTKLVGEIKFTSITGKSVESFPKNVEFFRIGKDPTYSLTETYKWISLKPIKYTKPKPKLKLIKPSFGKIKTLALPILIIFLLPIFTLLVGGGLTYVSYLQFRSGRDDLALNMLYAGKFVSSAGYFESRALKYIPLIGYVYKETEYASYALMSVSDMGIEGIPLMRTGGNLLSSVLGDSPYSLSNFLSGSDEKLQRIYGSLSNLEERTIKTKDRGSILAEYILSRINFEDYKQLVSQAMVIIDGMPNVLGKDKSKTYLVLFENNMELRPTGGFIGSYGLLTFDDGRLSDFAISDVYSADGQLNGHVEPPAPISQYLGEANWWLRDSNWDPDFPTSAKRAEWFLDKEMDKQVDGVISIDLSPIKNFLQVSGPIYLSDYDLDITANNLYERVQSEVQEDFFAGTHKKASFLTALSRSILDKTGGLSYSQTASVLRLAYENLEQRHVQVFLHDADFQGAMGVLGWDGSVFTPICDGGCYSDLVGIVEANVGVNKSNYFVTRSVDIDVKINQGKIDRTLTLTLKNSASTSLGPSGRYKSYVRLLIPEDSTDVKIIKSFGQNSEILMPEITNSKGRKEIGTIIEILGGETKQLIFYWSGRFDKPISQYGLYFRKQAGIDGHPISITIDSPIEILGTNPTFTLTNQGDYVYNTTLVRDLFVRLSL